MELKIIRLKKTRLGVLGNLLIDGIYYSDTIENPELSLGIGIYEMEMKPHPGWAYKTPTIKPILGTLEGDKLFHFRIGETATAAFGGVCLGVYKGSDCVLRYGNLHYRRFRRKLEKVPVEEGIKLVIMEDYK